MKPGNVAGFSAGPVLLSAFGLVTAPAMAWLFTPEDIGRLDLFLSVSGIAALGLALGLDRAFLHNYHLDADKAKLLRECMTPALLAFPLAVAAAIAYAVPVSTALFGLAWPWLAPLIVIGAISSVFNRLLLQAMRMQERGWIHSAGVLLPKLVLLMALPLLWMDANRNFAELAFVVAGSNWLVTVFLAYHSRSLLRATLSAHTTWPRIAATTGRGLPLAMAGMLHLAMLTSGVWLLRILSDFDQMGIYGMAIRIATAAGVAQVIFSTIWWPVIHKRHGKPQHAHLTSVFSNHVMVVVIPAFCLAGMGIPLMQWLLPPSFEAASYLVVATVGQPLFFALSEVTGARIMLARKFHLEAAASACGFSVNMIVGWALIPEFGARGAAVGLLLGFFVHFLARTELAAWAASQPRLPKLYFPSFCLLGLSVTTALAGERLPLLATAGWGVLLLAYLLLWSKHIKRLALFLLHARSHPRQPGTLPEIQA